MSPNRSVEEIQVGRRVDGHPWTVRVIVHQGSSGDSTAVLGGMYGDKPLSCLAVHELDRQLTESPELAGTVILIPAVNLPALETSTRINPDHHALNRRFPGSSSGFLTDQFADALWAFLGDRVTCIVDLHSGTPTMGLWYTYDFGNSELSAAFGYLPVIEGHRSPGQLGLTASQHGIDLILPEVGGGRKDSAESAVEGAKNVLKYRGHLTGRASGPTSVPHIRDRRLSLASVNGALETVISTNQVGQPLEPGVVAWITNVNTGERVEEFAVEEQGAILLMTVDGPSMVRPGDFTLMVGYPDGEIDVPNH